MEWNITTVETIANAELKLVPIYILDGNEKEIKHFLKEKYKIIFSNEYMDKIFIRFISIPERTPSYHLLNAFYL